MFRPSLVALILCTATTLPAESVQNRSSFRVTTKILAGKDTTASALHLILFDEGLVYDLPQIERRFVTVFDIPRGRVILLDRETKVRSTIATDGLLKITAQAKAAATDPDSRERLGMLAEVQTESDENVYAIRFGPVEYQMKAQAPTHDSIARQFGEFTDLAARLNIVRRLGLPPFARMTLNDRMTRDGKLPLETSLTIRRGLQAVHYRSTHELIEQISAEDRKQINEVVGMLALYTEVDLDDFPK